MLHSSHLLPFVCPECTGTEIKLAHDEPRRPVMITCERLASSPRTPGGMEFQDWRCSTCGHSWRCVSLYPA